MGFKGITFDLQKTSSKDDALVNNMFTQGISGILTGCAVTMTATNAIKISEGYFVICGRKIQVTSDEIINSVVSTDLSYNTVVFEVDLSITPSEASFTQGVFKTLSASADYPVLVKQDLITGGTKYQLPFAKYTTNSNGVANFVDVRTIFTTLHYARDAEVLHNNNYYNITDGRYYTEAEINAKLDAINSSITNNVNSLAWSINSNVSTLVGRDAAIESALNSEIQTRHNQWIINANKLTELEFRISRLE